MFYTDPKSRRQFLIVAGKFALAIPVLPSLLAKKAFAQQIPAGGVVVIATRNGQFHSDFASHALNPTAVSDPSQPWAVIHQSPLTSSPTGGVNNVFTSNIVNGYLGNMLHIEGLDHANPVGHFDLQMGFAGDNSTFDQIAAGNLARTYGGVRPPVASLEITNPGPHGGRTASYRKLQSGQVQNVPALIQPRAIYDRIFGLSDPTKKPSILASLDLASAESTRLQNQVLSQEDSVTLANYFQTLRDLHGKISSLPALQCTQPSRAGFPENVQDLTQLADLQTTLASIAIACGVRVVTFYVQSAYLNTSGTVYDAQAWHNDSHSELPSEPKFLESQRWIADKYFMAMVRKLDNLGVFQNSIVFTNNDICMGKLHNNENLRVMAAVGNAVAGFNRRGYHVNYQRSTQGGLQIAQTPYHHGILSNQFFNSVLNAMGLTRPDYALNGEAGFGSTAFVTQERRAKYLSVLPGASEPLPWISL